MVVSVKDALKLAGISVVACCAAFVCALFLNYYIDLSASKDAILSETGKAMFDAQLSVCKAVAAITGGCLVLTSAVMLLFYIKNHVDTHGKELGILKALGYSDREIALRFWVFGLGVLIGAALGYCAALVYMPHFYRVQNQDGLYPEIAVRFHAAIPVCIVLVPALVFAAVSVLFALFALKTPALSLMRGNRVRKTKVPKPSGKERSFLSDLKITTLKSKKAPIFFIAFSAFCFSAMTQMSFSMKTLASEEMALIIVIIGLVLAYMTLFMSLTAVAKENAPKVAMLAAFGYTRKECSAAVFGAYRPISYVGFLIGTLYQYGLLKIMVTVVFASIEGMPSYGFDFVALAISAAVFVLSYELILLRYSRKITSVSLKEFFL